MKLTFDFSTPPDLAIVPADPLADLRQRIYIILNTYSGEVPLYREFGVDMSYFSMPANVAQSMITGAVAEAFDKFLPEAQLSDVNFSVGDTPDSMPTRIEVKFNE